MALTVLDVIRQATPAIAIIGLILAGSGVVPFFAAAIPSALIAIALTPKLAGRDSIAAPTFRVEEWWPLLKKSIPVALAATIAVIYLRVLTILMFEFSTEVETGLFSTSVRVVEIFLGIPWLVFSVALPVLSVASREDRERSRHLLQRMIDVGLIGAIGVSVLLCLAAPTILSVVGGAEYAGATNTLEIQSFALIAAFVTQACMFAAIAVDKTRELVFANLVGLGVIVALGVPMITTWDSEGAAGATLIAEFVTAAVYLAVVRSGNRGIAVNLLAAWKPLLAGAMAFAAARTLGGAPLAQATIAAVVYLVIALATRAVPPEVFRALRRRGSANAA